MNKSLALDEIGTRNFYWGRIQATPVVVVVCWLLMLVLGTDIIDASLLALAVAFGLMSVAAAGGIKSAAGLLNFIMIFKFLLVAMVLKIVTLQAVDSNLRAPRTTSKVMAVGFLGLLVGSVVYRHVTKIKGIVQGVEDPRVYLSLAVFFSVACLGSTAAVLVFQTSYSTSLTGGIWGVAHQFEVLTAFCVVPAMYYAWSSGSKRFLSHPLVLAILFAELALGLALTTKQGVMEPLLCYLSVGFIRYGMKSKAVWSIVAAGGFLYLTVIYPYSQYVRQHGGRDGSLAERIEVIQNVFLNIATSGDFRESVDSQVLTDETYLGKQSLSPVSRLAMVGEADRLIAATDATQSYTGWETIVNGLKLMVPSFLLADKPNSGGGNFLGHIAGDLAPDDMDTQVSYGFMANFYNAFGLTGVFVGTVIFIAVFYYVLRFWFADQFLTFGPFGSTLWYLLIAMMFEHSLIEAPLGNQLPALVNLVVVVGLIYVARMIVPVLGDRRVVR